MAFYFRITYSGKTATVKMDSDKVFVGRSSTCQIKLKDPLISNCHCLITMHDNHLVIKDLQSTNGVLINGTGFKEAKLYIGDIITLGKTTLQLMSKEMTPEQTMVHTNRNTQIQTIVSELSLPTNTTSAVKEIQKNKKIDPVVIDFPDDDDDEKN